MNQFLMIETGRSDTIMKLDKLLENLENVENDYIKQLRNALQGENVPMPSDSVLSSVARLNYSNFLAVTRNANQLLEKLENGNYPELQNEIENLRNAIAGIKYVAS